MGSTDLGSQKLNNLLLKPAGKSETFTVLGLCVACRALTPFVNVIGKHHISNHQAILFFIVKTRHDATKKNWCLKSLFVALIANCCLEIAFTS